jgi:hypothetical protein
MQCSDFGLIMLVFGLCIAMSFGILLLEWLCWLMSGVVMDWEMMLLMIVDLVLIPQSWGSRATQ